MKRLLILFLSILLFACNKAQEEFPEPYGVDTVTPDDTTVYISPLEKTTWYIVEYRIGPVGQNIEISDELKFSTQNIMYYNGYTSKYYLNPSTDGFMLTLYETRWGNISGYVYNYNISSGEIDGIEFRNIMNNNSQKIYLWIKRQ